MVQIVLPACPSGWAPPETFQGLSGFPSKREAINAGRAIHLLLNREEVEANAAAAALEEEANSPSKGIDFAAQASMADKEDFYQMLGLQSLRWRASPQEIRKAYRQCVLKYHPDKMAQSATEEKEEKEGGEEEEKDAKDKEFADVPKPVRDLIERLIGQKKSDTQIRNHYKMGEYVEGNDVCPKGLENPEDKIKRVRAYIEGKASNESVADQAFKALSQANTVLTDIQKRRAYDSKDAGADIDDALPADRKPKDDADFFATWAPVFDRNSRWSTTNMPPLGGAETPIAEVLKVYDKWFDMESWRDFSMEIEDGFDIDDASCREERRWMERQNKKQTETMKRTETNRINTMIENCHKWDPRIIKYKDDLKNEKKANKMARFSGQRQLEEDFKKKAEAEAAVKAKTEEIAKAGAKSAKEAKELAKRAGRLAKKALREAAEAKGLDPTDGRLEAACAGWGFPGEPATKCSAEDLDALAKEVTDAKDPAAVLDAAMARLKLTIGAPGSGSPMSPAPKKVVVPVAGSLLGPKKDKADRKFSRDEVDKLHKALIKFPSGSLGRWDKIAEFMVSRDAGECQRKCAELKNNFAATAAGMETDTSLEFQKSKDEALKGHGSRSGKGVRTSGTAIISDREIDREGTTHFKPKDTAGEEEDDDEPDFFGDPVNVTGKTAAGKKDAKKDPAEDWSVDEQKALEAAMAEFKTSKLDVKEKWKAIADRVPGRTDKDCVKRVKHIQSMLKK